MNEVPLKEWIDGGHYIEYDSHQIFVHTSGAVPNSADLHKWPDVGHWPPIEVPERIAKAIIDRLNG